MKKTFRFLASLTLGFMVVSCQNGLEEVINESEVQDELATTRAEDETPSDEIHPVVIPLVGDVDEIIANIRATSALVPLSGPSIIGGASIGNYSVTLPPNKNLAWSYDTSLLNLVSSTTSGINLQLINPNTATDTAVLVYVYNDNGSLYSYDVIYVGLNGPHANDCSLRILRASDGVEVSPFNLVSDTYYQAYFSTTTGGGNMTLDWNASSDNLSIISHLYYYCTFKTSSTSDNGFITVKGSMPLYGVNKTLLKTYVYWN